MKLHAPRSRQSIAFLTLALMAQTLMLPARAFAEAPATPDARTKTAMLETVELMPRLPQSLDQIGKMRPYREEEELGDRTPLIMIHGIGGTSTRYYHWEHLLSAMNSNKAFSQKYRIYFYAYDSTRSVPDISADLKSELTRFIAQVGRPIRILAYSEGGLLARNVMEDDFINENTDSVLTIATPFHGSPLANPEWLKQQVDTESPLNVVRLTQRIAYDITGRLYPTFKQDFHWDNFDEAIPADQFVKNNGAQKHTDYALKHKANFITYGSYFGMEADPGGHLPKALEVNVPLPKEELRFSNLFKKNFLFSLIRNNMGKLPIAVFKKLPESESVATAAVAGEAHQVGPVATIEPASALVASVAVTKELVDSTSSAPPATPEKIAETLPMSEKLIEKLATESEKTPAKNLSMDMPMSIMAFNDGISPISSTLWLGRYTPQFKSIQDPAQRVWAALKSLKGSRNARLFAGLDHRNWMDGVSRTDEDKLVDLLNPDEPPKTVFDWIIHDLIAQGA